VDPTLAAGPGYASGVRRYGIRLFALGTAALASALAGCGSSDGPATDGPLSGGPFGGPSGGADCAPAHIGQPVTFGDERFTNRGHASLVLDRVGLRHPHNLRLVGSFAVPGRELVGVAPGWPPRYSGIPYTWKYRQAVHDFRLAPGKSFNMVLGLTATAAARARSPGMVIYYHYSSGSYVVEDHFAMVIAVSGRC
jgi:hypothetical protein